MELLSVIVAVYNAQEYISTCINSLLKQHFLDYEIILVDDGSYDFSGEICDYYASIYANIITIHHTSNLGLVESRNSGIKISRGKYITFVDADDWVDDDMYADYIAKMEEYSDISISVTGTLKEDVKKGKDFFYLPHEDTIFTSNAALEEMFRRRIFGWELWGKIYRKSVMILMPSETAFPIGEDLQRNFQLWQNVKKVWFSCSRCYHYRLHWESMTKKTSVLDRNLWMLFDKIYKSSNTLEVVQMLAKKYLVQELIKRLISMFFVDHLGFYQDIQMLYARVRDLITDLNIYQRKYGLAKNIVNLTFNAWYNFFSLEVEHMKRTIDNISARFNHIYIYLIDNDSKYLGYVLKECDKYGGDVINHSDNEAMLADKTIIHKDATVLLLLPITSKNFTDVRYIESRLKAFNYLETDLTRFI